MGDPEIFFGSMIPVLSMVGTAFWIWMLVHCLSNAKLQKNKLWWFLLIFFTHWVGALIYFLMYVLPGSALSRWLRGQTQSSQWSTPYYQPSRPQPTQPPRQPDAPYVYQPYQSYQEGYQAQAPQYPPYPSYPSVPSSTPLEEQVDTSVDYEQPQTMYPEMPKQYP